MSTGLALAIAGILVLVNACFVAAEFATVSVRRSRIEVLARAGNRRAGVLCRVLDALDAHLSAGQIMITAAGIGIGWLGEPAVAGLLEPLFSALSIGEGVFAHTVSFLIAFVAITLATLVAGEIAPKLLGLRRAETVALWMAIPLHTIEVVSRPVPRMLTGGASMLLSLVGVQNSADERSLEALDPEELRAFVRQSSTFGRLSLTKRKLIENAIEFTEHTAKQIMVARNHIDYLNLDDSLEENLRVVHEAAHTRYPLCRSSLDTVVGMIHIKDLFRQSQQVQNSADLQSIQHDMLFVPETQPIDVLQRTFQNKRAHMAIVVDEYGVPVGLVTLEDVLEELVGEIRDEFDEDEKPQITRSAGGVSVDGMLLIEDLARELGMQIKPGEDDTVGGFVTTGLGRIARTGDVFRLGDYRGTVTEMEGRRIARVLLQRADSAGRAQRAS